MIQRLLIFLLMAFIAICEKFTVGAEIIDDRAFSQAFYEQASQHLKTCVPSKESIKEVSQKGKTVRHVMALEVFIHKLTVLL